MSEVSVCCKRAAKIWNGVGVATGAAACEVGATATVEVNEVTGVGDVAGASEESATGVGAGVDAVVEVGADGNPVTGASVADAGATTGTNAGAAVSGE